VLAAQIQLQSAGNLKSMFSIRTYRAALFQLHFDFSKKALRFLKMTNVANLIKNNILAEGAIALPVTLSGGVLFAS